MTDLPKSLGKAFLLIGFLPALLFTLLNAITVVRLSPEMYEFMSEPVLGVEGGLYLLVPLSLGCLLTALIDPLVRLFEGIYLFQRDFFLKPFVVRNQKQHDERFRDLILLKTAYKDEQDDMKRDSLMRRIVQEHNKLFDEGLDRLFPYDRRRILPTRLGNAWAAIEEYPAYRYGMDGVTFWPRIRPCVPKEYLEAIDDESMYIRLLLSLSFVLTMFGFESMLTVLVINRLQSNVVFNMIVLSISVLLGAYILYRFAVNLTVSMGGMIKSCFDLYRNNVLEEMGIEWHPQSGSDERRLWTGLTSFLLTGEDLYYPKRSNSCKDSDSSLTEDHGQSIVPSSWDHLLLVVLQARYGANAPLDVLDKARHK
jgi:hypothetical protein